MISIAWPSNRNRFVNLLKKSLIIICLTRIVITTRIRRVWSWKKDSCSIKGEALSCNINIFHVAISKKSLNFIYGA